MGHVCSSKLAPTQQVSAAGIKLWTRASVMCIKTVRAQFRRRRYSTLGLPAQSETQECGPRAQIETTPTPMGERHEKQKQLKAEGP